MYYWVACILKMQRFLLETINCSFEFKPRKCIFFVWLSEHAWENRGIVFVINCIGECGDSTSEREPSSLFFRFSAGISCTLRSVWTTRGFEWEGWVGTNRLEEIPRILFSTPQIHLNLRHFRKSLHFFVKIGCFPNFLGFDSIIKSVINRRLELELLFSLKMVTKIFIECYVYS